MPEKKEPLDLNAMPPSAADIRNEVIKRAREEDQKQAKAKAIQEQKAADFAEDFLKNHVSEADVLAVRRLWRTLSRRVSSRLWSIAFHRTFVRTAGAQ